jgi:hypothetical protein
MNGGWGVGGMSANYLAVKAALKSAASTAGVLWIDIDEYPIPTNSVTIQVVGGCCSASAGSTYFNTTELNGGPDTPPSGSTWQMGSGSTLERFQVKSVTPQAPNNVLIYPVSPLQYNHSAGDTITLVGGALYSGTGNSGSPSGFGNADVITSPDGLHPNDSPAGTGQIGAAIAQLLLQATAPN